MCRLREGLRLTCAFYAECAHEGSEGSEGGGGGFAADYKKGARLAPQVV